MLCLTSSNAEVALFYCFLVRTKPNPASRGLKSKRSADGIRMTKDDGKWYERPVILVSNIREVNISRELPLRPGRVHSQFRRLSTGTVSLGLRAEPFRLKALVGLVCAKN